MRSGVQMVGAGWPRTAAEAASFASARNSEAEARRRAIVEDATRRQRDTQRPTQAPTQARTPRASGGTTSPRVVDTAEVYLARNAAHHALHGYRNVAVHQGAGSGGGR